jgi:type II secretory pathway pseudopilin PulG
MLIRAGKHATSAKGRFCEAFSLIEVMMAFVIFGMVSAGILYGYVQANRMAEWSAMSLGAQSYASQGMEQAIAAKWDTEANGEVTADFCPPLSYTQPTNWINPVDTNDVPQSGNPLLVTNYMSVGWADNLTNGPYLRKITSQVVWRFPLTGQVYTNTLVTFRAPDQ